MRKKAFLIAQTGQSREVLTDTIDTVTTIVPTAALTTGNQGHVFTTYFF